MSDEATLQYFAPLMSPATVAVVGASSSGTGRQNVFIRRIRELGYAGRIYPIHPTAAEIDGLPAYPHLGATPEPIDYAFIGIAAAAVPGVLAAGAGHVKFAQVISSGYGETADGAAREADLVAAARDGGMRLLGPNCLGIYTPRGRITFTETRDPAVGTVGIVSQSGGLAVDVVRRGSLRGLRYSGVVTLGNCADLKPSELAAYYLADPQTRVIGLYLESARDGRRLFEVLRAARARKPVVILKGGRTPEGRLAAASHTGALAGDFQAWRALSRQTGCVLVDTLDEFLDALLAFQMLAPRPSAAAPRVVLLGNGGGTSVLAADYFSALGVSVMPFDAATVAALEALRLPPGTSVANPVDCPAGALQQEEGRVAERLLAAVYEHARPDALVIHLNLTPFVGRTKPHVLGNLLDAVLRVHRRDGSVQLMLVLRSDGDAKLEARKRSFRARALKLGIPVFDELPNAAHALAALRHHQCFLATRGLVSGLAGQARSQQEAPCRSPQ